LAYFVVKDALGVLGTDCRGPTSRVGPNRDTWAANFRSHYQRLKEMAAADFQRDRGDHGGLAEMAAERAIVGRSAVIVTAGTLVVALMMMMAAGVVVCWRGYTSGAWRRVRMPGRSNDHVHRQQGDREPGSQWSQAAKHRAALS